MVTLNTCNSLNILVNEENRACDEACDEALDLAQAAFIIGTKPFDEV